jgi:hypothetical protein
LWAYSGQEDRDSAGWFALNHSGFALALETNRRGSVWVISGTQKYHAKGFPSSQAFSTKISANAWMGGGSNLHYLPE